MEDKTKSIKKVIFIVILSVIVLIIGFFLYSIISLSLWHSITPKPEIQVKIENYLDDYNKSCATDKQVKIDYYYEGGPIVHCDLKFSEEITDDEAIISFFIEFHNNFGYEYFCNKEVNVDFFRKYNEVYFQFENIRMTYGDEIPLPMEAQAEREYIDAAIHGIYNRMDIDSETINEFKGTVYVF